MGALKAFICYTRKNTKAVKSFRDDHLRTIARQYGVCFRWDTHIEGGEAWRREIAAAIAWYRATATRGPIRSGRNGRTYGPYMTCWEMFGSGPPAHG